MNVYLGSKALVDNQIGRLLGCQDPEQARSWCARYYGAGIYKFGWTDTRAKMPRSHRTFIPDWEVSTLAAKNIPKKWLRPDGVEQVHHPKVVNGDGMNGHGGQMQPQVHYVQQPNQQPMAEGSGAESKMMKFVFDTMAGIISDLREGGHVDEPEAAAPSGPAAMMEGLKEMYQTLGPIMQANGAGPNPFGEALGGMQPNGQAQPNAQPQPQQQVPEPEWLGEFRGLVDEMRGLKEYAENMKAGLQQQ